MTLAVDLFSENLQYYVSRTIGILIKLILHSPLLSCLFPLAASGEAVIPVLQYCCFAVRYPRDQVVASGFIVSTFQNLQRELSCSNGFQLIMLSNLLHSEFSSFEAALGSQAPPHHSFPQHSSNYLDGVPSLWRRQRKDHLFLYHPFRRHQYH